MLSVVVPYYESGPEKQLVLKEMVSKLKDYDELIVVWNTCGFSKAVNIGCRLSRGNYIVVATDDGFLDDGCSLKDLCVPGTVTSPIVNGRDQSFSGVMWCTPRGIYETYGMLDERYSAGIFFEDEDYWKMLQKEQIPHRAVKEVRVSHPIGGRTLTQMAKFNEKVQINKELFEDKWGVKWL